MDGLMDGPSERQWHIYIIRLHARKKDTCSFFLRLFCKRRLSLPRQFFGQITKKSGKIKLRFPRAYNSMYIKRQWICYNMLTFPSLYGTPSTSKKSHLYLKMRYFFRHDSVIDGIRQDAPAHLTVVLLTYHQFNQYSARIFFAYFTGYLDLKDVDHPKTVSKW